MNTSLERILVPLGADSIVLEHLDRIIEPRATDLQIVLRSSALSADDLVRAFGKMPITTSDAGKLSTMRLLVVPIVRGSHPPVDDEISKILQATREKRAPKKKSSEADVGEILEATVAAISANGEVKSAVRLSLRASVAALAVQAGMSLVSLERPKADPRFLTSIIVEEE